MPEFPAGGFCVLGSVEDRKKQRCPLVQNWVARTATLAAWAWRFDQAAQRRKAQNVGKALFACMVCARSGGCSIQMMIGAVLDGQQPHDPDYAESNCEIIQAMLSGDGPSSSAPREG
ncbi:hypothetical protein ColTof3_07233 [Colletotrichum tofieldiae]|nr:hypothetical protein ColTof3_07233 [Colletotrichum tofieldiae]